MWRRRLGRAAGCDDDPDPDVVVTAAAVTQRSGDAPAHDGPTGDGDGYSDGDHHRPPTTGDSRPW